jgi:hypothetical protein
MKRTYAVRRSRAAGWARGIGGLAVPVLVMAALGARAGIVPEVAILPVLALGFVLGILARALAAYSLTDIWNTGAEGAGTAILAIVYASPVLALLGLIAGAAAIYPQLTDIATDPENPPRFIESRTSHQWPRPEEVALQQRAYPNITARSYPLPLPEVHLAARKIMEERGWTITRDTRPVTPPQVAATNKAAPSAPEDEEVTRALARKGVMTQSRSEAGATPTREATAGAERPPIPMTPSTVSALEAISPTPVFGFVDDVVVRLRATANGTDVDMRSASRQGEHDLGQNARRIRSFLSALDKTLQPPDAAGATGIASIGR